MSLKLGSEAIDVLLLFQNMEAMREVAFLVHKGADYERWHDFVKIIYLLLDGEKKMQVRL